MMEPRTFQGFLRPDGRVGTRNYLAVISTVNCSASTSRYIAERFRGDAWRKDYPNVDGVFAVDPQRGCAIPFDGPDHNTLERVLAGFANHPNVAAYVIVGSAARSATPSTWSRPKIWSPWAGSGRAAHRPSRFALGS